MTEKSKSNPTTTEEVLTDPRFNIKPNKDFTKGTSLVFLLHHYGLNLGDSKYKAERLLAGDSINATLPDVENVNDFYRDLGKIGLEATLVNEDTFFISK